MHCLRILIFALFYLTCSEVDCQDIQSNEFIVDYNKALKLLKGDLDSSLHYINKAEMIALRNDSISWRFRANLLEAVIYKKQEKYLQQDSIHKILDSLKSQVSKEYQVYYFLGVASAQYIQENYKIAFDLYFQANEILDTAWINYKTMKTGTLSNLGLMSSKMRDYNSAINYNLEVLKLNENHYTTLNNLGNLFRTLGDFKTSEYYFNACFTNKSLGYRSRYTCLYGLQSVYKDLGNIDSSIFYLKDIVSHPDSCRKSTYFRAVDALTTRYILLDSLDQAKKYLDILETLVDNENRENDYQLVNAELFRKKKKYAMAKEIYSNLIGSDYLETANDGIRRDVYRGLIDSEFNLYDKQKLMIHWNNYISITDSIKTQSLLTSVLNAERKFNVEKKQNEIKLLVQQEKISELTISKLRAILLGSVIGLSGIIFGFYYFLKKNKNEKDIAIAMNDKLATELKQFENDPHKILLQKWHIIRPPRILKVSFNDIIAVIASNKKSRNSVEFILKGVNDSPLPKMTLTELNNSNNWPNTIFCRIHNSTIVNLYEVLEYDAKTDFAIMKSGNKYSVSDKYRSEFKVRLLAIK